MRGHNEGFNENLHCDPSLELSQRDSSNEGSHRIILWSNKENILELSLLPLLIWTTNSYC